MRALAVLSPELDKKVDLEDKCYIPIDSLKIPIALIHVPDEKFDEDDDRYADYVLVKKKGFSLNYRDFGVIESAWNRLKETEGDSYYPIGSDFCGEVVKIGSNVTNLSVGDLVIQDGFYPEGKENARPGLPTNHGSKELETLHKLKLIKLPKNFPLDVAFGLGIGAQTGMSMINKAKIKKGDNVLVTSVTSYTSLFLLNLLHDYDCNIYGLSYSGKNIEYVRNQFPNIKDIFSLKENAIPENLVFDAVLDPFSDTYFPHLILTRKLNYNCRYLTCGIFNQTTEKIANGKAVDISKILPLMVIFNIQLIGNCLGSTEDLEKGIDLVNKNTLISIDSNFNEDDNLSDFIHKSFNMNKDRLGKVCFTY